MPSDYSCLHSDKLNNVKIFYIFIFLSFSLSAQNVRREYFNISAHGDYFEVIGPSKFHSQTAIIVNNRSLSPLIGKVQNSKGKTYGFMRIPAKDDRRLDVDLKNSNSYLVFIPLSPPFQKVILEFGKKNYRIPSEN